MFRTLFVEHPESVGETYGEHLGVAFSFGVRMIGAGLACLIHGLVPGLFRTSGSAMIACLHNEMVTNRRRKLLSPAAQAATPTLHTQA
jgi:Family of unknown function (DUF6356)